MSKDTEDADLDRIKKATRDLGEYFDSVTIFATRHEPSEGGTVTVVWGEGNWFARYGQVKQWCIREDESMRIKVRQEDEGDDEETD